MFSSLHSSIARELRSCVVLDKPVDNAMRELDVGGKKWWCPFLDADRVRHQLGLASFINDEFYLQSRDVSSIGCSHSGD